MVPILEKRALNASVALMTVAAPDIARKAEPGQFIILRSHEDGERVPLTIADFDREAGTVTIIFQIVGKSTRALNELGQGDSILDFVGPLGKPSHLEGYNKVAVIGGGLGCAIAYPQAKKLHQLRTEVDIIAGFRNRDLIILEEEMRAVSTRLFVTTDDGSNGTKGFVTDILRRRLEDGDRYDMVVAIGPLIMMKMVSALTREYSIKTIVSMNPVMVDGTGMCGGCRVTVAGETKFACVDGPDFDGHEVDFDEAMRRARMYQQDERASDEAYKAHLCRITGEERRHA